MKCPNCANAMQTELYEGVEIDRCNICGGTWLDDGEIRTIVQEVQTEFTEEEKLSAFDRKGGDQRERKPIHCPKCNATMTTFQYLYNSGVFIDSCPNGHGIYLDNHELEMVQIFMEESLLRAGKHPQQNAKKIPLVRDSRRVCPRDGTPLTEITYESVKLDRCGLCGGFWCDPGELQAIIAKREIQFQEQDRHSIVKAQRTAASKELVIGLRCIICRKPMIRSNYAYSSGIIIDYCPDSHGVWLDRGELEQIQILAEKYLDESPQLREKFNKVLSNVGEQAASQHKQAMKEAARRGRSASIFGRFVNSLQGRDTSKK